MSNFTEDVARGSKHITWKPMVIGGAIGFFVPRIFGSFPVGLVAWIFEIGYFLVIMSIAYVVLAWMLGSTERKNLEKIKLQKVKKKKL